MELKLMVEELSRVMEKLIKFIKIFRKIKDDC